MSLQRVAKIGSALAKPAVHWRWVKGGALGLGREKEGSEEATEIIIIMFAN